MRQIISYFWQICLLRAGPEQLPATRFALGGAFLAYFVVAMATNLVSRSDVTFLKGMAFVTIGVTIEAMILAALLAFKSVQRRFLQSMTALLGANTLILLMTLPISVLLIDIEESPFRLLLESVFLCVFVWWLTIAGHIIHRAADVSLALGIAAAFGIEIIAITTTYAAFPAT